MLYAPTAKWEFNPDADIENTLYSDIVWNDVFYAKPSEVKLNQLILDSEKADQSNTNYQIVRKEAYPSVEEQLDYIFHNGLEAWKEKIQAVKDEFPKP